MSKLKHFVRAQGSTGCTKSQDRCLNFERIYLEYYYRYNGKIKIYSRFGYGKSIALGFSSVSIAILKIYTFRVQTVDRTFEAPCTYTGNKSMITNFPATQIRHRRRKGT